MTHAIVLIEAERVAMPTLGGALADVEGVAEAYSVTGEWDFVAIVRVREPEQLRRGHHAAGSRSSTGIKRTHTMVAFEVFSQHDLEALFSIGEVTRDVRHRRPSVSSARTAADYRRRSSGA